MLIPAPPAAPHTKPHSPNPQGVGKGGQLHSSAPWGPIPATSLCQGSGAPGTLPEVSTWKDFRAPFPSRSRPVLSTFCIWAGDTPRRCLRTLRSWGFWGSCLCPLPAFPTQSLPPTRDGAGLTQGPVSRELPTCLAGLAGLTVRGAWGGGGKGGAMGRGPQSFPLPGKQTKQTLPGSLAQRAPPPHTPMPTRP